MLSGCTSTELVMNLYQVVSTEINIPNDFVVDWLRVVEYGYMHADFDIQVSTSWQHTIEKVSNMGEKFS